MKARIRVLRIIAVLCWVIVLAGAGAATFPTLLATSAMSAPHVSSLGAGFWLAGVIIQLALGGIYLLIRSRRATSY